MIPRYAPLLLVAFTTTAALSSLSCAAAQAPATSDMEWEVPRTLEGHPGLQGNWTNETATPFEREESIGPVFTQEEVERIEQREEARFLEGQGASDPGRPPPVAGGDVGNYNNVYFARGDQVAVINGEPGASLVTNPRNGRGPPLTPEGERRAREYGENRDRFGHFYPSGYGRDFVWLQRGTADDPKQGL